MTDPASGTSSGGGTASTNLDLRALVRKHLGDPTHVFTDEEISSIRISAEDIDVSDHPLVKAIEQRGVR